MIAECINDDCCEFTETPGGLCPVCMGLAQRMAEERRKHLTQTRCKLADGILMENAGKARNAGCHQCKNFIDTCTMHKGDMKMWGGMAGTCADFRPER